MKKLYLFASTTALTLLLTATVHASKQPEIKVEEESLQGISEDSFSEESREEKGTREKTPRKNNKKKWERSLQALYQFRADQIKQHGKWDGKVPKGEVVDFNGQEIRLGTWVNNQRKAAKADKLTREQLQELEESGLKLEIYKALPWETYIAALNKYKEEHGGEKWDGQVSRNAVVAFENQKIHLWAWVNNQRKSAKEGKRTPEQLQELDAVDLRANAQGDRFTVIIEEESWEEKGTREKKPRKINPKRWERCFRALNQYKEEHGGEKWDGQVSRNAVMVFENQEILLGDWVSNQRTASKLGKLPPEQLRDLDAVGLRANAQGDSFEVIKEKFIEKCAQLPQKVTEEEKER